MRKKFVALFVILSLSTSSIFAVYPKVALVLSGGGARGLAQVAIVEEIQKMGIPIDFIAGTSIGALVGGYYAAGYSSEEIFTMLNEYDLASMLLASTSNSYPDTPPVFLDRFEPDYSIGFNKDGIGDVPGLVGDQKIQEFLSQTLIKNSASTDFSLLPIPYKAVSVNATTSKQIILDSGILQDSMRSSMSLPLVFPPYVLLDGRYTMDGGLKNNMPIDVAERWGADIIIAVNVSSDNLKKEGEYSTLSGIIQQTINLITFNGDNNAEQRCDIVLNPDVSDYSVLDMVKQDEIIQKGYDCIEQNREKLVELRDRIAETRTLSEYKTVGEYSKIPDPVVKEVKIINVIGEGKTNLSLINIFDKFIGKSLTKEVLNDLNSQIDGFNKINSTTTTSYSFQPYDNNTDENDGILYLYIRDWNTSESNISINLGAKYGISNYSQNSSWTNANLDLNILFDDVNGSDFDNNLYLSLKDVTTISGDVKYNIIATPERLFNGSMQLMLQTGGISPANSSYMKLHLPSNGFLTSLIIGGEYKYSNNFRAELALDYTIAMLNDTLLPEELASKIVGNENEQLSYTDSLVSEIIVKAGVVYNLKDISLLSNDGFFVKLTGMYINNNSEIGYGSEFSFRYSHPITNSDTLKLNFALKFNEKNEELISSYYDVGGYLGMIGYPSYTLRRGYMLADLTYQKYLGEFGVPLYLQTGIKLLTAHDYDPSENLYNEETKTIMKMDTSSIDVFSEKDLGVYVGIGSPLGIATAMVGIGVTIKGNVSLVLELI